MILLDTNVCIDLTRNPQQSVYLVQLIKQRGGSDALVSAVSIYELEMGVLGRIGEKQARLNLNTFRGGPISIEPLTKQAAAMAAKLNADARKRGHQMSGLDSLIAGHALFLGAALVTNDKRLAAAVSEVEVVNWR